MKVTFIEKKYKIASRFKDVLTEKLQKLDKYFGDDSTVRVVCSKQGNVEKLEINITNKGVLFRSEVASGNMYDNIDLSLPKLERQIVRNKQKVTKSKRVPKTQYEFIEEAPETKLPDIIRKKSFTITPMLVEDAKDAIERLDHSFYIFLNVESGKVNVIYKRADNKYGLIEVDF
ncbi:MAG: ribosome-associated translation inhibitor RaiA [Clostridia bacterium]|nr:ribosome-associated translation inhibitor RaiA [Clostridia bacterium]